MIWYGIVLHWIIDQDSSICTISYHEEDVQFWNAFSLSLHRLYFATNLFYVALQALNFFLHICTMISFGGFLAECLPCLEFSGFCGAWGPWSRLSLWAGKSCCDSGGNSKPKAGWWCQLVTEKHSPLLRNIWNISWISRKIS